MKKTILFFWIFIQSSIVLFANSFYIDPTNGNNNTGDGTLQNPWQTLEYVINNNLIESMSYVTPYDPNNPQLIIKNQGAPIKAGDVIWLYSGLHGEINLSNYINTDYITIKNVTNENPIIKRITLQGAKKWQLDGLDVSSEPYNTYINDKLVYFVTHNFFGPVSDIEIKNCNIYSSVSPWTVAQDWVNKASDGIILREVDNVFIINNTLTNVKFGVSLWGNNIQTIDNTITNFSADAMRLLGSNNLIEHNIIKNCYDVDDNHDDAIQAFTTGGLTIDNNSIKRNIILNYEDPNQPLLGPLQGIACFDGPLNNWLVENNLVVVNHWHGISLYGAVNCTITNNTVLDPTPNNGTGPSWIKIEDDGSYIASDCTVKNNIINTLSVTSNTAIGNNTLLSTFTDYSTNFVDYTNYDFHLLATSSSVDNADANFAPNKDLDNIDRPQGNGYDIGCYEYPLPLNIDESEVLNNVQVYPNPFTNHLNINNIPIGSKIKIFDVAGNLVYKTKTDKPEVSIPTFKLTQGVYFIQIINKKTITIKAIRHKN